MMLLLYQVFRYVVETIMICEATRQTLLYCEIKEIRLERKRKTNDTIAWRLAYGVDEIANVSVKASIEQVSRDHDHD